MRQAHLLLSSPDLLSDPFLVCGIGSTAQFDVGFLHLVLNLFVLLLGATQVGLRWCEDVNRYLRDGGKIDFEATPSTCSRLDLLVHSQDHLLTTNKEVLRHFGPHSLLTECLGLLRCPYEGLQKLDVPVLRIGT